MAPTAWCYSALLTAASLWVIRPAALRNPNQFLFLPPPVGQFPQLIAASRAGTGQDTNRSPFLSPTRLGSSPSDSHQHFLSPRVGFATSVPVSIAMLNIASSRIFFATSNRMRIAHICSSLSGGFWPTSFPLFQGALLLGNVMTRPSSAAPGDT